MSFRRVIVLIAMLALLGIGALSVQAARTTGPLVTQGDHSYDSLERIRSTRSAAANLEDQSYDEIELIRSPRYAMVNAKDHSYDEVERIRSTR